MAKETQSAHANMPAKVTISERIGNIKKQVEERNIGAEQEREILKIARAVYNDGGDSNFLEKDLYYATK